MSSFSSSSKRGGGTRRDTPGSSAMTTGGSPSVVPHQHDDAGVHRQTTTACVTYLTAYNNATLASRGSSSNSASRLQAHHAGNTASSLLPAGDATSPQSAAVSFQSVGAGLVVQATTKTVVREVEIGPGITLGPLSPSEYRFITSLPDVWDQQY